MGNIPPVYAMTTIIQAVPEVGNQVLEKEGVMDKLMVMAQSENRDAQCAAAEALAHAASDKKRAKVVLQEGFNLLKALYAKDLPDSIRVRALCGICKLSSRGWFMFSLSFSFCLGGGRGVVVNLRLSHLPHSI